ncbi:MAG TPA: hypothetical protein VGH40_03810 [Roseiarcus sp.]|jgi:hypothetical protein
MPSKSIVPSLLAVGTALVLATSAHAAIGGGAASVAAQSAPIAPVENVQFVFGGRNYCWYSSGWRGPGYYWCGYAWRRGYGWGGGWGWNGWGMRGHNYRYGEREHMRGGEHMGGPGAMRLQQGNMHPSQGGQGNMRPAPGQQGNMRPAPGQQGNMHGNMHGNMNMQGNMETHGGGHTVNGPGGTVKLPANPPGGAGGAGGGAHGADAGAPKQP